MTYLEELTKTLKWAEREFDTKDLQVLWDTCPYGKSMLWLIAKLGSFDNITSFIRCCVEITQLEPPCKNKELGILREKVITDVSKWLDGSIERSDLESTLRTVYASTSEMYPKFWKWRAMCNYICGLIHAIDDPMEAIKCITYVDKESSEKRAEVVRKHFPNCPVVLTGQN